MIPIVGSEVHVRGIVSDSIDDSEDHFVEVKGWPRSLCVRISDTAELAGESPITTKVKALPSIKDEHGAECVSRAAVLALLETA